MFVVTVSFPKKEPYECAVMSLERFYDEIVEIFQEENADYTLTFFKGKKISKSVNITEQILNVVSNHKNFNEVSNFAFELDYNGNRELCSTVLDQKIKMVLSSVKKELEDPINDLKTKLKV